MFSLSTHQVFCELIAQEYGGNGSMVVECSLGSKVVRLVFVKRGPETLEDFVGRCIEVILLVLEMLAAGCRSYLRQIESRCRMVFRRFRMALFGMDDTPGIHETNLIDADVSAA